MSSLRARNLLSTGSIFARVESSGRLRVVFGLFGQRHPADQKARRLWVRWRAPGRVRAGVPAGVRVARIGQITVPLERGNAGSREENEGLDFAVYKMPSGRPKRVVKRWWVGVLDHTSRSRRMEIYLVQTLTTRDCKNLPFYEKQFCKLSPLCLWIAIVQFRIKNYC